MQIRGLDPETTPENEGNMIQVCPPARAGTQARQPLSMAARVLEILQHPRPTTAHGAEASAYSKCYNPIARAGPQVHGSRLIYLKLDLHSCRGTRRLTALPTIT